MAFWSPVLPVCMGSNLARAQPFKRRIYLYFSDMESKWLAMKTLDVEAVQAFVLTADLNSFTRAAEALDTTQSAVSLKIKRLEDGLGRRLLERTPRRVRLSAEGTAFLGAARHLVAAHQSAVGAFAVEQRRLIVGIR